MKSPNHSQTVSRLSKTRLGIFAALIVLTVCGIFYVYQLSLPNHQHASGTRYLNWYPEARALPEFELVTHEGLPLNQNSFKDTWSLVFVGFTYCPDICPVTLAELSHFYPELKASSETNDLQVVFISVDPKRDTVERLNQYISFFNEDFIAATGQHDALFPIVRSMGMMYSLNDDTNESDYLVDHSASIVVVNPQAQVIGRFKPQFETDQGYISDVGQIVADMPFLLAMQ